LGRLGLRERPHTPFGIHLALSRDSPEYRWGPAAAKADVASLLAPDTDEFYINLPAQRLRAHASRPTSKPQRMGHPSKRTAPNSGRRSSQPLANRQSDHASLTSPQAREILDHKGITVIDCRPLQQAWIPSAPSTAHTASGTVPPTPGFATVWLERVASGEHVMVSAILAAWDPTPRHRPDEQERPQRRPLGRHHGVDDP
jgi:hypothetical protein